MHCNILYLCDVLVNMLLMIFLMRNEYSYIISVCYASFGSKVWYFFREGKLNQLFSWPGSPIVECVNFERVWILILILMCENVLKTLMKYWFDSPNFVNKTQLNRTYMLTELYKLIHFYVLTLQGRISEKDIKANARWRVWAIKYPIVKRDIQGNVQGWF